MQKPKMNKKWICSERTITACTMVTAWLCHGCQIWPKCDITRTQRPMRALASFTLQRNLHANMHRMQLLGYSLQPGCSGRTASCVSGGSTLMIQGTGKVKIHFTACWPCSLQPSLIPCQHSMEPPVFESHPDPCCAILLQLILITN